MHIGTLKGEPRPSTTQKLMEGLGWGPHWDILPGWRKNPSEARGSSTPVDSRSQTKKPHGNGSYRTGDGGAVKHGSRNENNRG